MRQTMLRRGGAFVGLLAAVLLAFWLMRETAVLRSHAPLAAEHDYWVALATQQAATFAAQDRPATATARGTVARVTAVRQVNTPALPVAPTKPAGTSLAAGAAISPGTPLIVPSVLVPTLALTREPEPTPTGIPSATLAAVRFVATAMVDATEPVNLRSGPGTEFPSQGFVEPGTLLTTIGETAVTAGVLWQRVQLADGRSGWIRDVNIALLPR